MLHFIVALFWALTIVYVIGLIMGIVTFEKKEATITIAEPASEDQPEIVTQQQNLRQAS